MNKYRIIFCGELQEGYDRMSVRYGLSKFFTVKESDADKLFQSVPVLIRTDLTQDSAIAFKKEFDKTGAICRMLEMNETFIPPVPPSKTVEPAGPQKEVRHVSDPVNTTKPDHSHSGGISAGGDRSFSYRKPRGWKALPGFMKIILISGLVLIPIILFNTGRNQGTDAVASAPRAGNFISSRVTPFTDPNNYYSIDLPSGFTIDNKSTGPRSKLIFHYSGKADVTIIASPMDKPWDPAESMNEKVYAILNGGAGELSRLNLDEYQLVTINGMDGYELVLSDAGNIYHAYALVSGNNIAFSLSTVSRGGSRKENHDILDRAIRNSLNGI